MDPVHDDEFIGMVSQVKLGLGRLRSIGLGLQVHVQQGLLAAQRFAHRKS